MVAILQFFQLYSFARILGGDVEDLGQLDGISQWDTLTGRSPPPRQEVLVQIAFAAAIIERDGDADWKLVKTKGKASSYFEFLSVSLPCPIECDILVY